jgi:hypothetical protein
MGARRGRRRVTVVCERAERTAKPHMEFTFWLGTLELAVMAMLMAFAITAERRAEPSRRSIPTWS